MRKFSIGFLCLCFTMLFNSGIALADTSNSTPVNTSPSPILTSNLGWTTSINGDMVYIPLRHVAAGGATITLASFKDDLIELKAGGLADTKGNGIGAAMIAVSLPKLISLIGGNWIANTITVDVEGGVALAPTGCGAIQPIIGGAVISIPLTK